MHDMIQYAKEAKRNKNQIKAETKPQKLSLTKRNSTLSLTKRDSTLQAHLLSAQKSQTLRAW